MKLDIDRFGSALNIAYRARIERSLTQGILRAIHLAGNSDTVTKQYICIGEWAAKHVDELSATNHYTHEITPIVAARRNLGLTIAEIIAAESIFGLPKMIRTKARIHT